MRKNIIIGTDLRDSLQGTEADDVISAGDGNDYIFLQYGHDIAHGGNDNDFLIFQQGDHTGYGDAGNDFFLGDYPGGGNHKMYGGAGNDGFNDGGGNTLVEGGSGDDLVYVEQTGINVYRGGSGFDSIEFNLHAQAAVTFTIGANGTFLLNGSTYSSFERFLGTHFDDHMTGNASANRFEGANGNDTLSGMDGNDYLAGGKGADTLTGGLGDDTYVFRASDLQTGVAIDVITDFTLNDHLDFSAMLITDNSIFGVRLNDTVDGTIVQAHSDVLTGWVDVVLLQGQHGLPIDYLFMDHSVYL